MCCQQTVGHTFNQSLTHTFTLHCTVNMLFTDRLFYDDTFRSWSQMQFCIFTGVFGGVQMQQRALLVELKSLGGVVGEWVVVS